MQELYYVSHDGQELGPFTADEIIAKVKNQELWSIDYVYVEAQEDWVVIEEYAALADKIKNSAPNSSVTSAPPQENEPFSISAATVPPAVEVQAAVATFIPTQPEASNSEINVEATPKEIKQESVAEVAAEPVQEVVATSQVSTQSSTSTASPNYKDIPQTAFSNLIKLVDGVGQIDVTHFVAETVRLKIVDESKLGIELPSVGELAIKPDQAKKIVIKGDQAIEAGATVVLTLEAQDEFGNIDQNFKGQLNISLSGSAKGGGHVVFSNGKCQINVSDKVAEVVTVQVTDPNSSGQNKSSLDLSGQHKLTVKAGPAKQFIISAPRETVAGQPVTVMVKAVDAYGNLATDCHGNVKLNIEGTPYERVHGSDTPANGSKQGKVRGLG